MLKILQRRLPVSLSEDEAHRIQRNLQMRFKSLLYGVRLEYLRRLELEMEDLPPAALPPDSNLAAGELFMPVPGTILYFKVPRGADHLEAGAIVGGEGGHEPEEFFEEIREAVLEIRGLAVDWEPLQNGPTDLDIEDGRPEDCEPTEERLEASRVLMEAASRQLLERFLQSGSTFLDNLEVGDREEVQRRIHRFEELGLVTRELAVLCRRTGQQILRVTSRSTIEESSQKGFKCFICGSPIAQERVDELVSCTEMGEQLLEENRWLLVLLEGTLNRLGISTQQVVVQAPENGPIHLYLRLGSQKYLVVLTDERLTLEQSYRISAPLAAYRIENAVLVSTHPVSTLMRHHLAHTNPGTSFHYVETLEGLEEQLRQILIGGQRAYLREVLAPLSDLTPVRVQELVLRKMMPDAEDLDRGEAGEAAVPEEELMFEGPPPAPEGATTGG